VKKCLEEEFEVKVGVKEVQIAREEGREIVIIRMDSWKRKEEIMSRKKKFASRKIYTDDDLTQEEREVQRILRKIARSERADGRRAREGYRRIGIKIHMEMYIWSEEENKIIKRSTFRRTAEVKE